MLQITKEVRKVKVDLSTRRGYTIATSLRGPDLEYTGLKHVVTAWIRSKCGVTHPACNVRVKHLNKADIADARKEVDSLTPLGTESEAMGHWVDHAIGALGELGTLDEEGVWLEYFLSRLASVLINPSTANKERVHRCLDQYPFPNPITIKFIGGTK